MARKWISIGTGAGAGVLTITGLFAVLVALYGFNITGTNDFMCDSTFLGTSDWCESYIYVENPTGDYVDVYSSNSAHLKFTPAIDDYYLFYEDPDCLDGCREAPNGIKLDGWSYTDFTYENRQNLDTSYVYRFDEHATETFKLIGRKGDNKFVKWDFVIDGPGLSNGYLDPIWGNNFTKTDWIPNIMDFTEPSVGRYHSMPLNLTNPTDETIIINLADNENLGVRVDDELNPSTVYLDVPILVYNYTEPIWGNVSVEYPNGSIMTVLQIINYTEPEERTKIFASEYGGVHNFEIFIDGERDIQNATLVFNPGESHIVDMRGETWWTDEVFDIIPIGWGGFEYTEAQTWEGAGYPNVIVSYSMENNADDNTGTHDLSSSGTVYYATNITKLGSYSLYLNDAGSLRTTGATTGFTNGNVNISYCGWYYFNDGASDNIMLTLGTDDVGGTGAMFLWAYYDDTDRFVFFGIANDMYEAGQIGTVNLTDSSWHHVCGNYYASNHSLEWYIDGEFNLSYTLGTNQNFQADMIYIGARHTEFDTFKGYIDEVAVFNGTLTQDAVSALYNDNDGLAWPYDINVGSNPVATINSPTNNTDTLDQNPTVNGTCTDADPESENMTYSIWFDSTLYYQGNAVNGTSFEIENASIDLTQCVNYTITLNCTDEELNEGTTTASGIYIGPTSTPSVTLSTPSEGSNTSDTTFNFVFTAINTQATTLVCAGFVNDTPVAYNGSTLNNTETTITANNTGYGYWTANVSCENVCGFSNSDTNNFYLGFALYGQTLKATGGAEPNVTILLINESSNTVYANWTSDASGIWQYNLSAAGTWQLDGRPTASSYEGEMIWNFTTN